MSPLDSGLPKDAIVDLSDELLANPLAPARCALCGDPLPWQYRVAEQPPGYEYCCPKCDGELLFAYEARMTCPVCGEYGDGCMGHRLPSVEPSSDGAF